MIATKLHLNKRKKINLCRTGVLIQEYDPKTQKNGAFQSKNTGWTHQERVTSSLIVIIKITV